MLEALLRVGQLIALDPAEPAHGHRRRAAAGPRIGACHDLAAGRDDALGKVARTGGRVDKLELELGGLAEQRLERGRILEPRHLHHDALRALADDRRLAGAERVDALADHLGGGVHRLRHRQVDPGLGRRQLDPVAVEHLEFPVALPGELRAVGQRQDRLARLVELRGILNHEADRAVAGRNVTDPHVWRILLETLADILIHRLEPLTTHLVGIGLKQDVTASSEIEAQIDLRVRQHRRPAQVGEGKDRGQRGQHRQRGHRPVEYLFPAGKIEHVFSRPAARVEPQRSHVAGGQSWAATPPGCITSAIVARTARTFTLGASSSSR